MGLNVLLTAVKGTAGVMAGSAALVADAVHSVTDLISDVVTLWAVQNSRQPADDLHPFGHGKFESLATLFVSGGLLAAGAGILWQVHDTLLLISTGEGIMQGGVAFAMSAALLSVGTKEFLYRWTMRVADRTNSSALKANAWHHRSDASSSLVALFGIGGTALGYPLLDPLAGLVVAGMIGRVGWTLGREAMEDLLDEVPAQEVLDTIAAIIHSVPDVRDYKALRVRRAGPFLHVDVQVLVYPSMTITSANRVGQAVREAVKRDYTSVSDVVVQVLGEQPDSVGMDKAGDVEDDPIRNAVPERSMEHIHQDIVSAALRVRAVKAVTHTRLHFVGTQRVAQLEIEVDQSLTVQAASGVARQVRKRVETLAGIDVADVHLELDDSSAQHGV